MSYRALLLWLELRAINALVTLAFAMWHNPRLRDWCLTTASAIAYRDTPA